jgi:2-dehydro-3-deoxy-D-gluconate 5-dehydrogenase
LASLSVLSLFDLEGSTALVTGGGGALGHAMAEALRDAGARVGVVGRSEHIFELEQEGFSCLQADLTEPNRPAQVIADAIRLLGKLDILVNAHGTVNHGPAEAFSANQWDRILSTNLTSVFQMAQAAAIHFLPRRQGKIINIASMLSFSGGLRVSPYAASKGGVAQLTKALANEWAPHGINVNAIAPGYFTTPMTEPLRSDRVRNQQILDRLPAGRWGEPNDLRGAVIFLASAASGYVHGIILPVDGGWLSR